MILVKLKDGNYSPATPESAEESKRKKVGSYVEAKPKSNRSVKFHRKYFALLNLLFESWQQPELEHKGETIRPSFDRFRKDIAILSGFYDTVVNIEGDLRLEPKSISFGNMSEEQFSELYSKTIDLGLERIAPGSDYDRINAEVEQVIGFYDKISF